MSFQALNWATRLVVGSSTTKFVLMALANYADDEGMCFPSVAMLMGDTELSKRAVSGAIKTLCDKGLLVTERQRNEDGSLGRNRYRLQLSRSAALSVSAGDDAPDNASETGEPCAPDAHGEEAANQVHMVPSPGAPHDAPGACGAPPIDEPPIEPPSEPSTLRESAQARGKPERLAEGQSAAQTKSAQGGEGDQPDGSTSGATTSGGELKRQAEENFKKRFWPKWPDRVSSSKIQAQREFLALSVEDQNAAIAGIVPYHEWLKGQKQTYPRKAATYLKEAKWEELQDEPSTGGKYVPPWAKPWSPLFVAQLIELLRTGQGRAASFSMKMAADGTGSALRFGHARDGELVLAVESFERVPSDGPRWKAWRAWFDGQFADRHIGTRIPHFRDDPSNPFWLSVPSNAMAKAWGIELPAIEPTPDDPAPADRAPGGPEPGVPAQATHTAKPITDEEASTAFT